MRERERERERDLFTFGDIMNNNSPSTFKQHVGTCYWSFWLIQLSLVFNSLAIYGIADLANLSVFA